MAKRELTHEIKHYIIESILEEIPTLDYENMIRRRVRQNAKEQLPPALQSDEAQKYIGETFCEEFQIFVKNAQYVPTRADKVFVKKQRELAAKQRGKITSARYRVRELLERFVYVEDFVKQAPEFARYVPQDSEVHETDTEPVDTRTQVTWLER